MESKTEHRKRKARDIHKTQLAKAKIRDKKTRKANIEP